MSELLPCPFCGEPDRLAGDTLAGEDDDHYAVICGGCGAATRITCTTRSEAIAAWNRRTPPAAGDCVLVPAEANVERVSRALREHLRQKWVYGPAPTDEDPDAEELLRVYITPESIGEAARAAIAVALTAARDDGVRPAWLPIESAPKDGTDVLVAYAREDIGENWPDVIVAHYDRDGYWVWQSRAARGYSATPTHWQPLPPPPVRPKGADSHE